MMQVITIDEGKNMDFILKEILKLEAIYHSKVAEINYLWRKFLNDKGEYYSVDLVYKILDHEPKVLVTDKRIGIRTTVWPTQILEDFLSKGGFTKLANENAKLLENKLELERLNLEKAKLDVKNSKRIYKTYWRTFSFSLTALIVSLILLYLKISEGR